jgi:hypothetical protein
MLIEVGKERLGIIDSTENLEFLDNLEDPENPNNVLQYLFKSSNGKLPITFKKKINDSMLLISRLRTQTQSKNHQDLGECEESGQFVLGEEEDSLMLKDGSLDNQSPTRSINQEYIDSNPCKPLLNSK